MHMPLCTKGSKYLHPYKPHRLSDPQTCPLTDAGGCLSQYPLPPRPDILYQHLRSCDVQPTRNTTLGQHHGYLGNHLTTWDETRSEHVRITTYKRENEAYSILSLRYVYDF